jgi:hypothetical protein
MILGSMKRRAVVIALVGAIAGVVAVVSCRRPEPTVWTGPVGSGKPFLTRTAVGELLLTWLESRPDGRAALRIATTRAGRWSEPSTIAEHDRFFVNWADFPSVIETTTGAWVAHWLEKTEAKPYAYHVRLSVSPDQGRTWSAPVTAHQDRSATEHGFVAMVPNADGTATVAWLDGGRMVDSAGTMEARVATVGPSGAVSGERVIDPRTCECCQVSMARARNGLVVAYRDRSESEVRDIAIIREVAGTWSPPALVAEDNWVWKACPVNGPSIAASGDDVGVAWYSAPGGTALVQVAFSRDGGASFGPPVRIDDGNPVGRVHLQIIAPGRAVVVWLETAGDQAAWRYRSVEPSGAGPAHTIGPTSRTRDAGFPRTALVGNNLMIAWTEPGASPEQARIRVDQVRLDR